MRILKLKLILLAISFNFSVGYSQQKKESAAQENITEGDWHQVVDYVTAEVVKLYINEQDRNGKLTPQDKENYTFKEELEGNSYKAPINPDNLEAKLQGNFSKTSDNLLVPVQELKQQSIRTLNLLFNTVNEILVGVQSKVQESSEYKEIRKNLENEIERNNIKTLPKAPQKEETADSKAAPMDEDFPIYKVLSGVFFVTTLIFLFLYLKRRYDSTLNANIEAAGEKSRKREFGDNNPVRGSSQQQNTTKEWPDKETRNQKHPQNSTRSWGSATQDSSDDKKFASSKSNRPIKEVSSGESDRYAGVTTLTSESSNSPKNSPPVPPPEENMDSVPGWKQTTLYAGKASENGNFEKITSEPQFDQTIFRLITLDENSAEFEVAELSDYMTTEVTNSPDDYLYRVCFHENSNQDFREEIITTRKGTAHLIDDRWTVKEENKATIKFQ